MWDELDARNDAEHTKNDEIDAKGSNLNSKDRSDSPVGILNVAVDSDTYNMNHKNHGKCLIFNNKSFDSHIKRNIRHGTDVDADSLKTCFENLGFTVTLYPDATKTEIKKALEQAGKEDHTDNDCFACVILTHGKEGLIYGRDGMFSTDSIFEPFLGNACPSLAGKPKLFFIQACEGDKLDSVVSLETSHDGDRLIKIPEQSDILMAYSTMPGFYAWKNGISNTGSWYIQALCKVLRKHAGKKDLVEMLTMVNLQVACDFKQYAPKDPSIRIKRVPSFTSRLTRKVYFSIDAGNGPRDEEIDTKGFCLKSKNLNDPTAGIFPVTVDSDTYDMSHEHRGMCLIFNNKHFDPHTGQSTRRGTDTDAHHLVDCFKNCLDFTVTLHTDATKNEITNALKEAGKRDHTDNDCFACVFSTHGNEGIVYAKDGKFRIDSMFEYFLDDACPSLAGKPKLFFIQACQGEELDPGVWLRTSTDGDNLSGIPSQPDILVAYGAVPGFYSWRGVIKGSWFIRVLCGVLKNYARVKDLVEMLTMVNRQMGKDFVSYTPKKPSNMGKKQVQSFTSRLTRKVCFPSKRKMKKLKGR